MNSGHCKATSLSVFQGHITSIYWHIQEGKLQEQKNESRIVWNGICSV